MLTECPTGNGNTHNSLSKQSIDFPYQIHNQTLTPIAPFSVYIPQYSSCYTWKYAIIDQVPLSVLTSLTKDSVPYEIVYPQCTGSILRSGAFVLLGTIPPCKDQSIQTSLERLYFLSHQPIPSQLYTSSLPEDTTDTDFDSDSEIVVHHSFSSSIPVVPQTSYPVAFLDSDSAQNPLCLGFDCPVTGIPDLPVPLIGRSNCLNRMVSTYYGPSSTELLEASSGSVNLTGLFRIVSI